MNQYPNIRGGATGNPQLGNQNFSSMVDPNNNAQRSWNNTQPSYGQNMAMQSQKPNADVNRPWQPSSNGSYQSYGGYQGTQSQSMPSYRNDPYSFNSQSYQQASQNVGSNTAKPPQYNTSQTNYSMSYNTNSTNQYGTSAASQYGSNTTSQYGNNTASQYGTNTASQYGTNTAAQYGTNTTSQYGNNTAAQYGNATSTTYNGYSASTLTDPNNPQKRKREPSNVTSNENVIENLLNSLDDSTKNQINQQSSDPTKYQQPYSQQQNLQAQPRRPREGQQGTYPSTVPQPATATPTAQPTKKAGNTPDEATVYKLTMPNAENGSGEEFFVELKAYASMREERDRLTKDQGGQGQNIDSQRLKSQISTLEMDKKKLEEELRRVRLGEDANKKTQDNFRGLEESNKRLQSLVSNLEQEKAKAKSDLQEANDKLRKNQESLNSLEQQHSSTKQSSVEMSKEAREKMEFALNEVKKANESEKQARAQLRQLNNDLDGCKSELDSTKAMVNDLKRKESLNALKMEELENEVKKTPSTTGGEYKAKYDDLLSKHQQQRSEISQMKMMVERMGKENDMKSNTVKRLEGEVLQLKDSNDRYQEVANRSYENESKLREKEQQLQNYDQMKYRLEEEQKVKFKEIAKKVQELEAKNEHYKSTFGAMKQAETDIKLQSREKLEIALEEVKKANSSEKMLQEEKAQLIKIIGQSKKVVNSLNEKLTGLKESNTELLEKMGHMEEDHKRQMGDASNQGNMREQYQKLYNDHKQKLAEISQLKMVVDRINKENKMWETQIKEVKANDKRCKLPEHQKLESCYQKIRQSFLDNNQIEAASKSSIGEETVTGLVVGLMKEHRDMKKHYEQEILNSVDKLRRLGRKVYDKDQEAMTNDKEVKQKEEVVQQLNKKMIVLTDEYKKQKEGIGGLAQKSQVWMERANNAVKQLDAMKKLFEPEQTKSKKLEEFARKMKEDNDAMKEKLLSAVKEIDGYKDLKSKASGQFANMKNDFKSLQKDAMQLKNNLTKAVDKIKDLQTNQIGKRDTKIEELTKSCEEKSSENETLKSENEDLLKKIKWAREHVSAMDKKQSALEEEVNKNKDIVNSANPTKVEAGLKNASATINALKSKLAEQDSAFKIKERALNELKEKQKKMAELLVKKDEELTKTKGETTNFQQLMKKDLERIKQMSLTHGFKGGDTNSNAKLKEQEAMIMKLKQTVENLSKSNTDYKLKADILEGHNKQLRDPSSMKQLLSIRPPMVNGKRVNPKIEKPSSDEDTNIEVVDRDDADGLMDMDESDPLQGGADDGTGYGNAQKDGTQDDGALPLQITSVSTLSKAVPKKVGRYSQAFVDQANGLEGANGEGNGTNASADPISTANSKSLGVVSKAGKGAQDVAQKQKPQIKLEPAKSQELVPVTKPNKSMKEIKEARENANKASQDGNEANKTNETTNNEKAIVPVDNMAKRRARRPDVNNNIKTRNSPIPKMNGTGPANSPQVAGKANVKTLPQVKPVVMGKSDAKKNLNAPMNNATPGQVKTVTAPQKVNALSNVVKPIGTVASLASGTAAAAPKILPAQALTKVSTTAATPNPQNANPKVLPTIPTVKKVAPTANGVVKSLPKQPLTKMDAAATKIKPVTKVEPGVTEAEKAPEAPKTNTPIKNLPTQALKKATVSLIKLKDFSKFSSANTIVKSEKKDDNIAS